MDCAKSDLELMVGKNEKIFWKGKPDKVVFILESIFNPALPFTFLWALFDSIFIALYIGGGAVKQVPASISLAALFFILFHLMPVWMYLGGVIFTLRRYNHIEYIIANKGIYISSGLFSFTCNMKPFAELARVDIQRGVIDQMIGVGDVVLTCSNTPGSSSSRLTIADIKNYRQIFSLIKKLQEDIFSDTMYPNDLRPKENHGYQTKYRGLE